MAVVYSDIVRNIGSHVSSVCVWPRAAVADSANRIARMRNGFVIKSRKPISPIRLEPRMHFPNSGLP